MPALLTSTSIPPKALVASANIVSIAAASLTSALAAMALPPAAPILATSVSASSALPE